MDHLHHRLTENIRYLASDQGISLNELPRLAKVSRGHFFSVLAGKTSPTLQWMGKVAAALGVDTLTLLDTEPPESE